MSNNSLVVGPACFPKKVEGDRVRTVKIMPLLDFEIKKYASRETDRMGESNQFFVIQIMDGFHPSPSDGG